MDFRSHAKEDESEDAIRARLAKLKGIPENTSSNKNVLLSQPAKPNPLQEKDLIDQLQAEIELEKNMPDPDEELEERLAKLKGVDVETVRHPGKGFDRKPAGAAGASSADDVDPMSILHDHSDYSSKNAEGHANDKDLMNDISSVTKEVSLYTKNIIVISDVFRVESILQAKIFR